MRGIGPVPDGQALKWKSQLQEEKQMEEERSRKEEQQKQEKQRQIEKERIRIQAEEQSKLSNKDIPKPNLNLRVGIILGLGKVCLKTLGKQCTGIPKRRKTVI